LTTENKTVKIYLNAGEEMRLMKKNIWSNVYYRLNEPIMIRLAVLYTLKYIEFPISSMDLKHVMLDATSVDYIDLCENIELLKEENHIKTVFRDEMEKYEMTQTGEEMIDIFEKNLLQSIRSNIRKSADELFRQEFEKSQVRSEISPSEANTFYLDAELNDGKTKMLSMSIFAGSRENAMKMRSKFNEAPVELFQEILKFLKNDGEIKEG